MGTKTDPKTNVGAVVDSFDFIQKGIVSVLIWNRAAGSTILTTVWK